MSEDATAIQANSSDQAADPKQKEQKGQPAQQQTGIKVDLGNGMYLLPERRLPDFEKGRVLACAAVDDAGAEYIATLSDRACLPRVSKVATYRNMRHNSLMNLHYVSKAIWPEDGIERYVLVFQKVTGKPLLPNWQSNVGRMNEDMLIRGLITPVLNLMQDFHNLDLIHGQISPTHMYISQGGGTPNVILGECVSTAPGATQHTALEPVERAMALPMGRGLGTIKDDLYSLGICVAMLARGVNMFRNIPAEEIIQKKMELGSYGMVIGRERLPGGITEFLRGVLNDSHSERWGIDSALKWLEGRRLSPRQPRMQEKASRSYGFKGEKYWFLRNIAQGFADHHQDAADVIIDSTFYQWVIRNFSDQHVVTNFENLIETETSSDSKASSPALLVAKTCMVLDHTAPLRYKGVSMTPAGYGSLLSYAYAKEQSVEIFKDILKQNMFSAWVNAQEDLTSVAVAVASQYDRSRGFLSQKIPGYGIERVLYVTCNEAPCMSDQFKKHFVYGPTSFAYAMEDIVKKGQNTAEVLDRHMIAFLSVREPKTVDPHLGMIVSNDPVYRVIGLVRTFAALQQRFKTAPLPHIGDLMLSRMDVVLQSYRNRPLRHKIEQLLAKEKGKGNLNRILEIIDNSHIVKEDQSKFAIAAHRYIALINERIKIETALKSKKKLGHNSGRQVSMLISAIIATLLILGFVALHFMEHI